MVTKLVHSKFSVHAADVGGSGGSVFLVLLVIAIALAISSLGGVIRAIWDQTEDLLRGLWSAMKGVLLLGLALICVIWIALGGQGPASGPTPDVAPPPAPDSAHQTPPGTEPPPR